MNHLLPSLQSRVALYSLIFWFICTVVFPSFSTANSEKNSPMAAPVITHVQLIPFGANYFLDVTFDQNIFGSAQGAPLEPSDFSIAFVGGTATNPTITSVGSSPFGNSAKTLSFTFEGNLSGAEQVFLDVSPNSVFNSIGQAAAIGQTHNPVSFPDNSAPLLVSSTPADNSTGIFLGQDITLTFDDDMRAQTNGGGISIRRVSDGSSIAFFDVETSSDISISGNTITINPPVNLTRNTAYYIQIDGNALEDDALNDFAGINNAQTLNFTTVDVLINEVVTEAQSDWSSDNFDGTRGEATISVVDEWVELYINSDGLDLSTGWSFSVSSDNFSGGLSAGGAFQRVSYFGEGSISNTQAGDYLVMGNPISTNEMSNSVTLSLMDPSGAIVDELSIAFGFSSIYNESVQRFPNATDTDNVANDLVQGYATLGSANIGAGPYVSLSVLDTNLAEGGGAGTISAKLSATNGSAVSVSFSQNQASDTETSDWSVNPVTINFTPGIDSITTALTATDDLIVEGIEQLSLQADIQNATLLGSELPAITISDNDAAGFSLSETSLNVGESGTSATFTVVLDAQPSENVVFEISSDATDEVTTDLSSLTFSPSNWNVVQTVTVMGVDDQIIDGNQNATVSLSIDQPLSQDSFDALADQSLTVTNLDDDLAGFTIDNSANQATEDGTNGSFSVMLTAQPFSAVNINIRHSSSELSLDKSSLTFTPDNWNIGQEVIVSAINDIIVEATELIPITLNIEAATSDDNFDAVVDQTINSSVVDDDIAGFSVNVTQATVSEQGQQSTFDVVLTGKPDSPVFIDVGSSNSNEVTTDLTRLEFTTSNWDSPQTVTISSVDDIQEDGNVQITLTLSIDAANSNALFSGLADRTIQVTSIDNDGAGFTVESIPTVLSENGTSDDFTIVLDARPGQNVVLSIISSQISEITSDVSQITFNPFNWDQAQTVTLTGADDQIVDGAQTLEIRIGVVDAQSDPVYAGLSDQVFSLTNQDNDIAGFIITESDATTEVSESGSTDNLSLTLSAAPLADVVIAVQNSGQEVSLSTPSFTFTPANWNVPQELIVTGLDDNLIDGNSTTTLDFNINAAASQDLFDAVESQQITVTNTDDDTAGFTINKGSLSLSESGTTEEFTVVLNAEPASDVIITLRQNDESETSLSASSLTFSPANWDTPQSLVATGLADDLVDEDISFDIELAVDANNSDPDFSAVPAQNIRVTNSNTDTATLSIDDVNVNESDGTIALAVRLDVAVNTSFTILVSSNDGSALQGNDYTVVSETLTFAGTAGETQTFNLTVTDDQRVEFEENLILALSQLSTSLPVIITDTAEISIADNDTAAVSIADISTNEDAGETTLTATLDKAVDGGFTITLSSSEGTATLADSDYVAFNQNLTFTGTAGETQTFTLLPTADNQVEADETIHIVLSGLTTSLPVDISDQAQVTIENDDVATITLSDASFNEASGTVSLTATLDKAMAEGFTIDVVSSDATATATDDYTALMQTLSFSGTEGETQSFSLDILNDELVELDETLTIDLANLVSTLPVTISATATITIVNDDSPEVGFAIASSNGAESMSPADIEVQLSTLSPYTATVHYTISSLSSSSNDDYVFSSGTLSFAPGTTSQFLSIAVIDDAIVEADETVIITLSDPSNATLGNPSTHTYSINNNDTATITINDTSVNEEDGTVTLTAMLDLTVEGGFSIALAVNDGTATQGTDYDFPAGSTLIFAGQAGEQQQFVMNLIDDSITESDESFEVYIQGLSGTSLPVMVSDMAMITIADNDSSHITINNVTQNEGNEGNTVFAFSVTLTGAIDQPFSLSYATADSTAMAGDDYDGTEGTLNFNGNEGEVQLFNINVTGDTLEEPEEIFKVLLSGLNANNRAISIDDPLGLGFILNEDDNTAPSAFSVAFNDLLIGQAEISTSSFTIENGEIGAGFDYSLSDSGNSTLLSGSGNISEANQSVILPSLAPLSDGSITLSLTLSDAHGNTSLPVTATTILDTSAPEDTRIIAISEDTGMNTTDGITSDTDLEFSGRAEAGSTVFIDYNSLQFTTQTDGDGNWSFDYSATPLTEGTHEFSCYAIDEAGNQGSSSTYAVQIDLTAPMATLSSSAGTRINRGFEVVFTFSEPIAAFDLSDVAVVNGTAETLLFNATDNIWTTQIVPSDEGEIEVSLPSGMLEDIAGNPNGPDRSLITIYDATAPSVTEIVKTDSEPVLGSVAHFSITFSEPIIGLDLSDLTLSTTGTVNGQISAVNTISTSNYSVQVDQISGEGTFRLDLTDDDSILDLAGNNLGGSGIENGDFTGEAYRTNFSPTDLTLSPAVIAENNALLALVGVFTADDPDNDNSHEFALVAGDGDNDNGSFRIENNQLLANEVFDFELKNNYSIRVRTTDNHGAFYEEILSVDVANVLEGSVSLSGDLSFEDTGLGLSSTQVLEITNTGEKVLNLNVESIPEGFSVTDMPSDLDLNTTIQLNVVFTPLEERLYQGELAIAHDDGSSSIQLSGFGAIITAIEPEPIIEALIKLFPNPATESIKVDLSVFLTEPEAIQLSSASGIPLNINYTVKGTMATIDTRSLPSGIYILRLSVRERTFNKKFIVKK